MSTGQHNGRNVVLTLITGIESCNGIFSESQMRSRTTRAFLCAWWRVAALIFLCSRNEESRWGVELVDQRRPTGAHLQYEYGDGDGECSGLRLCCDAERQHSEETVRRGTAISPTIREEQSPLYLDDLRFYPHWSRRRWIREAGPRVKLHAGAIR